MRKLLEARVGQLSDTEFRRVMDMATCDIKFNKILFGSRTSLNYVLDIAAITVNVIRR
jgi:hypothetical protein